ncbi:MAG: hypothetical protein AAF127_09150 [Pseudomonadota bacterium]
MAACAPGDGIDADGSVFDGIAPGETITLGGTEPFWGLDIAPATPGDGFTARFSSPSGDIDPAPFSMQRFAGNNGLGFNGELAGKAVQVAITPGDCSDGMSDQTYPFAATVALGDATLLGCGHTDSAPATSASAP